jgi:two-component system OmpR family response regulator
VEYAGKKEQSLRVLLVEDHHAIGSAIRDHISGYGHRVDWAMSLANAREYLAVSGYDLLLLDLGLPDGRGIELLKEVRDSGSDMAIIITTAQDQIAARISGLNAGADDYMVKPFDLDELSARVAAVARRAKGKAISTDVIGRVSINFADRVLLIDKLPVEITSREWAILERLLQTRNAIVSKSDLEEALYAFGAEVESNAIEVYVSRLRKKLGRNFINTLRGIGYTIPREKT